MIKRLSVIALFLILFSAATAWAAKKSEPIPVAIPGQGITIYMDVNVGGRTDRAAKRMTELHENYFAMGFIVVDVEPYIENGDLQGFFITYVGSES